MKKKILFTLMLAIFGLSVNAQQCLSGGCSNFNNQYPLGTLTPSSSWTIKTGMNGGNWTLFSVTMGDTYEWTYCEAYGGVSTNWDAQLTLFEYNNPPNANYLCYSDDYCGTNGNAPYIGWTATFTGTVLLLTSEFNCATNAPNPPYNTLVYRKSASGPSCTPVTVATQPQNQTVTVGNTATFNVSVNGTPPFSYFWYKNEVYTNVSTVNSSNTSDSYTTPTLTTGDNGNTYYCLIINCGSYQAQSNNAYLTVNSSCTSPSSSVNSPSGTSPLTITCTTSGGSGGSIAYKWYSGSSCSGTVLGTSSTLSVSSPSGYYSCKAYITGYESTCYDCATGYATINSSAPAISLSGNMNFGNVQVGNTSQQTLTITNTGNATLNVSSITYPTGFTGSWNGSIAAGSYYNVTVTFTPSSAITYSGIITINSNATSGTNTINCSGTGTQSSTMPDLEIASPIVNITNLIPLASTQITYTINNIGNGVASSSITSFFLSTNNVFNVGIDTWIKDDNVPSIAATGSITHTVTVSIPDNTPTGLWYIIIIIDAPANILESNETNNVSFVSINVSTSISCTENTFPFGDGIFPCSTAVDPWSFNKYQCVSYVAWKVNEFFGETSTTLPSNEYPFHNALFGEFQAPNCYTGGNYRLSDACYWAPILEYREVTVNNIPSVGSIAYWQSNMNGASEKGHVAYVSSVSGLVICITEYNWGPSFKCKFNYRIINMTSDPNRPTDFIHIEASGLGGNNITEMRISNLFNIYPNPTTDFLNIEIGDGLKDEELTFSLFNIFGQLAYEEKIISSLSTFSIQFLPAGYYIYKITDRVGIKNIGKIIKY